MFQAQVFLDLAQRFPLACVELSDEGSLLGPLLRRVLYT
jgi:hypothetical protein